MPNIGATTLATMTLQAQRRADMENTTFISASEWTGMVNASCQQLHEKLVEAYGNDYELAATFAITTDGTNDKYDLPTDFFKLLGVDLQLSASGASNASGWVTLRRFNFSDRNKYSAPSIQTVFGRTNMQYRLAGGKLWLTPLPAAGQPLRLWYAPRFTPLSGPTDSFDGINGWEEWVVNDVAMKACVKEETSISDLQRLQAVQEDRLASIVENRDAGSPATTVDVYASNGGYGPEDGSEVW